MATKIQIARTEEPQLRPNAVQLAAGQPVINYNETEPGLYFKLRDGTLCKMGPAHVGPFAPNSSALGWPGNSIGELWLDTTGVTPRLRVWTGTNWTSDADVTLDSDQTLTGVKTFTAVIEAQAGVNASGQNLFAESLNLTGTAASSETTIGMPDNTLATKGYVDLQAASASLNYSLRAGLHITGEDFNGTKDVFWDVDATPRSVANSIVSRDEDGGFDIVNIDLSGQFRVGETSRGARINNTGAYTVSQPLNSNESVFTVRATDGLSEQEKVVISANGNGFFDGNVGLGVKNPTFKLDIDGSVRIAEKAITPNSFNLSESNNWTCGAITVPAPTNAVAGISGLIRIYSGPVIWNSAFKFPGGAAPTITQFPALIPFYVQNSTTILMGNVIEGIN